MKLEDSMLGEQASHKKTNIMWFCMYRESKVGKFTQRENKMVVSRGEGKKGMGLVVWRVPGFSFATKGQEADGGDAAQRVKAPSATDLDTQHWPR